MPRSRRGRKNGKGPRRTSTTSTSAKVPPKPKVVDPPPSSSDSDDSDDGLFSDDSDDCLFSDDSDDYLSSDDSDDSSDSDCSSCNVFGGSSKRKKSSKNGKKAKKHKRSSWARMDFLRRDNKYMARQTELLESIIPESSGDENDGSISEASYASSGHYNDRWSGIHTESDDSARDENPNPAEILYKKFYETDEAMEQLDEEMLEPEDPDVTNARHAEMVKRLHVRQSQLKNLRPLQQLCLQSVASNLEYYTAKQKPFNMLSGEVLEELTKVLDKENKLMTLEVFPLILTPNCRYIPLNLQKVASSYNNQEEESRNKVTKLEDEHLPHLVMKIIENCNVNVEKLELCNTQDPYSFEKKKKKKPNEHPLLLACMMTLLDQLVNLKELTLGVGNFTDTTMAIIGSTCTQLKVLKVMGGLDLVSDTGLSYIGKDDGKHGKCKQLEVLVLHNIGRIRITKRGLASAMFHLPELKTFNHGHGVDLYYRFAEMYRKKRKLKLELFQPDRYYRHRLGNVLDILPELKILDTGDFQYYRFDQFYNLPNIQTLIFRCNTSPLKIISLVTSYSQQLKELSFIGYEGGNIDWSVIGYHCINLKSIRCKYVGNPPTQKSKYVLGDEHFSKLSYFSYVPSGCSAFHRFNQDAEQLELANAKLRFFPENVLQCILSSPVLQTFEIQSINISNKMLDTLISKARDNEKVFSNLEKFTALVCTVNYEKLKDIICLSPMLKIFYCYSDVDNKELCRQVKEDFDKFLANFNIKLNFHAISSRTK